MPQPYEIINLRRRLKANGFSDISIKEFPKTDSGRLFVVKAVSPLTGKKEMKLVTLSEAEAILRKHKHTSM